MINTLETSIKLRSSGFPEKQVKALTEVIANNESIEIKRINKKMGIIYFDTQIIFVYIQ